MRSKANIFFCGNQLANILSELLIMCHFTIIGTRRNSVAYNVTFYLLISVLILQRISFSFKV